MTLAVKLCPGTPDFACHYPMFPCLPEHVCDYSTKIHELLSSLQRVSGLAHESHTRIRDNLGAPSVASWLLNSSSNLGNHHAEADHWTSLGWIQRLHALLNSPAPALLDHHLHRISPHGYLRTGHHSRLADDHAPPQERIPQRCMAGWHIWYSTSPQALEPTNNR